MPKDDKPSLETGRLVKKLLPSFKRLVSGHELKKRRQFYFM
jgi:hypothetical protein